MKRIFLFILTNILVMFTISIVVNALGLNHYMTKQGIDYKALALFCLVWGMAGSFISLLLSKTMAKYSMGVKVINPSTAGEYAWLYQMVSELSHKAGLPRVPEVGIYESPEVNAFATGPSKRNSLVAVSTGLINNMTRNEIEGVVGHEIAHIQNGDMVTMVLIQGVVNAFTMFLARVLAFFVTQALSSRSSDEESASSQVVGSMTYYLITMVFDILFTILGSMVVMWFSRQREFRADEGGARYAGKADMISALRRLQGVYEQNVQLSNSAAPATTALKISGKEGGILSLFSSHPPLSVRIKALESQMIN